MSTWRYQRQNFSWKFQVIVSNSGYLFVGEQRFFSRPWITLGIKKSSKRKQRLKKVRQSIRHIKTFWTIKRKSKRNYFEKKYLDIKITLKNMEFYERNNRKNKQIRVSSIHQAFNQQKRREMWNWHSKWV